MNHQPSAFSRQRSFTRLAVLALASALAAGCRAHGPAPDGSGTIECTQVQVSSQVAGRILRLPVQEGMRVREGDPIAQIDARDY